MTAPPVVDRALLAIRRRGCEGEVFLEQGRSTRVAVSSGKIEALEVREDHGASVRVFDDRRVGFAFTSDLSDGGIDSMVERAREIARHVAR
jgi:PmbA protein